MVLHASFYSTAYNYQLIYNTTDMHDITENNVQDFIGMKSIVAAFTCISHFCVSLLNQLYILTYCVPMGCDENSFHPQKKTINWCN